MRVILLALIVNLLPFLNYWHSQLSEYVWQCKFGRKMTILESDTVVLIFHKKPGGNSRAQSICINRHFIAKKIKLTIVRSFFDNKTPNETRVFYRVQNWHQISRYICSKPHLLWLDFSSFPKLLIYKDSKEKTCLGSTYVQKVHKILIVKRDDSSPWL